MIFFKKPNLPTLFIQHFVLLAVIGALLPSEASAALRYSLTDLGTLGGDDSYANAINEAGQIVGSSMRADGRYHADHAFLYQDGHMTDLGAVGADDSSSAFAINSSGQIAGFSNSSEGNKSRIFFYSGGTMVDVGSGGYDDVYYVNLAGIDDAGEIAYGTALTGGDGSRDQGYLYTNGQLKELPVPAMVSPKAIDAHGRIFGYGFFGPNDAPRFYDHGKITYLSVLEKAGATPAVINDLGQVFGTLAGPHFFSYSRGKMTTLNAPWKGQIAAANNHGDLVGVARFAREGPSEAFLFTAGRQIRLTNILTGPVARGWKLTRATGINDAGQIVGYGVTPTGFTHAFRLDPPPVVTISGPLRITTRRDHIILRGKTTGSPERIYATVGRQRRHGEFPVVGITRWHVRFPLHKGTNYLNLRAYNRYNTSDTTTAVVERR